MVGEDLPVTTPYYLKLGVRVRCGAVVMWKFGHPAYRKEKLVFAYRDVTRLCDLLTSENQNLMKVHALGHNFSIQTLSDYLFILVAIQLWTRQCCM